MSPLLPEALARDAYVLGPGDQVALTILDPGAKDLGGTFEILNDGSAALALLGSVVLEGLTINQATAWLESLYKQYLLRPSLTLQVVRPRPIQVSIVGEVENPGLYSLTTTELSDTGERLAGGAKISGLPTVVTAIQKAGGLTQIANITDVRLQRALPGEMNLRKETQLDLLALLQKGDKRQNPFLFDGDTLVVGKAIVPDSELMERAVANLSPQKIVVNVVGEVRGPGRTELKANTPLMQAILAAGGPVQGRAKSSDVELIRINRNGTATHEFFRIDYSQPVSALSNPSMRDGDMIIVNRNNLTMFTDGLDAIARPITGLANIWALVRLIQDQTNN